MSRYAVPSKNPAHQVNVGWDTSMMTFFVQATLPAAEDSEDEDEIVAWKGSKNGELPTLEALAKAMAPHADLPAEIKAQLQADQQKGLEKGPTPFQRQMAGFFDAMRRESSR